jgi:3-dehydroquinate dehydratase/shikimate dehydrogenase
MLIELPSLPRSLPRICVALGLPDASQLYKAAEHEYKDGSAFLEFRLDYLPDPAQGIKAITNFLKRYGDARILGTCRHQANHGHFSGSVDQQIQFLTAAAEAGATAVDLEIESAEKAREAAASLRKRASLIVSYHNFTNTPALSAISRRVMRIPADAYKIIVTARKPSDNLRVIQFAREGLDSAPLVAFAMSDLGVATRILAPSCGCLYTYAAPEKAEGTASGQVSGKLMHSLYRCEKIKPQTHIYGVIADPVAHSKSPLIHNRGFQARRLDAVYLPFRVGTPHLGDWMKFASGLPVHGFSVTIPHKQRIIRYLDVVEPLAKRIGAVNTAWHKGGKWRGTNTDVHGVLKPLSRHGRVSRFSVLIAGYGGAARAAAIALADAGARVTITGRDLKQAAALARVIHAETLPLKTAATERFDVLINATPVGMSPHVHESLFQDQIPSDIVLDMVYNPHETELLKRAREQGCKIIYGSEMLLEQAARQFEIWTGEAAPLSTMRAALEQTL